MTTTQPSLAASEPPERPGRLERSAVSLLVRIWLEPQQGAADAPCVRCYVRDLRQGPPRYAADLDELAELLRELAEILALRTSELR